MFAPFIISHFLIVAGSSLSSLELQPPANPLLLAKSLTVGGENISHTKRLYRWLPRPSKATGYCQFRLVVAYQLQEIIGKYEMSLSRQQFTLLGIFALFLGPVILVILMRSSWWQYQPAGMKNQGHLVQPPVPLALETTQAIDGKWLILYVLEQECG